MAMKTLPERFHVFFRSRLSEDTHAELFEYIWSRYGRRISFYIANVVPFTHPAFEDVFQEVMFKIYRRLPEFNPMNSFKAWVYTIARNHSLDFIQKWEERMFANKGEPDGELRGSDDPESRVMAGEAGRRIDAYLASLTSRDREIAFLRFYENLSYQQIGRVVGMKPGTLRARVCHMRKDLAHELRSFL